MTMVRSAKTNPWMFRYVALLALCALVLIVLGAWLTSEIQPMPGSSSPVVSASTKSDVLLDRAHTLAAWVVGFLTLGLALWLQLAPTRASLRGIGWAALAVVVVEGWLGSPSVLQSLPRAAGLFHAVLAPVFLSMVLTVALAVSSQQKPDQLVEDSSRPTLRSLATTMLCLALLQILLGAAYRHGIMAVLLHILNALIVTVVVLVACILVMRQFPRHPSLRPAALALGIITSLQVCLGFATFILLLIDSGPTSALLLLSVAHVATGALTWAASVVLAIQIWRNVRLASRPI
jgi:cytochrome c oxidase assembly protein subunit 15